MRTKSTVAKLFLVSSKAKHQDTPKITESLRCSVRSFKTRCADLDLECYRFRHSRICSAVFELHRIPVFGGCTSVLLPTIVCLFFEIFWLGKTKQKKKKSDSLINAVALFGVT